MFSILFVHRGGYTLLLSLVLWGGGGVYPLFQDLGGGVPPGQDQDRTGHPLPRDRLCHERYASCYRAGLSSLFVVSVIISTFLNELYIKM